MKIQQIRNATVKIRYGNITFLIDPWFQDQGTGFSAKAVKPEMQGIRCPMNALPDTPERILEDVDHCFVKRFCIEMISRLRCLPDKLPLHRHSYGDIIGTSRESNNSVLAFQGFTGCRA